MEASEYDFAFFSTLPPFATGLQFPQVSTGKGKKDWRNEGEYLGLIFIMDIEAKLFMKGNEDIG